MRIFSALVASTIGVVPLSAIEIEVVYDYDTQGFFSESGNPNGAVGGAQARAAIRAAADRWEAVIDQSLLAVNEVDDQNDRRFSFFHPGTGQSYQVSAAASEQTDRLVQLGAGAASEYRDGISIPEDGWLLYVGGRNIGSAGQAGPFSAGTFIPPIDDEDNYLYRGRGGTDLVAIGGTATFKINKDDWHFDHTTAAPSGTSDFYTIALHEIGHCFGVAAGVGAWEEQINGGVFTGENTLAAYEEDTGSVIPGFELVSSEDLHWKDSVYQSVIFPAGNPNYVGTVGAGNLQDLIMEPIANFIFPSLRRFELTNVDVASLKDIGWSVIDGVLPTHSGPLVAEVSRSGLTNTLTWSSVSGASYQVQAGDTLDGLENVSEVISGEEELTSWEESVVTGARFYRVVAIMP